MQNLTVPSFAPSARRRALIPALAILVSSVLFGTITSTSGAGKVSAASASKGAEASKKKKRRPASLVAFTRSYTPIRSDVWLINARGKDIQRYTRDQESYEPEFSPEGRLLVYANASRGCCELFISGVSNPRKRRNLTKTPAVSETEPSYGPNGQIAFISQSDQGERIEVIHSSGSGRRTVLDAQTSFEPTTGRLGFLGCPSFSPDGSRIIFDATGEFSPPELEQGIYSVNSNGTGLTLLTRTNAKGAECPTISHNGALIAFANHPLGRAPNPPHNPIGSRDIMLMASNESGVRNFTNTQVPGTDDLDELTAAFSPEDQRLAFAQRGLGPSSGYELRIKNIFDLKERQLTNTPRRCPQEKCSEEYIGDMVGDWAIVRP